MLSKDIEKDFIKYLETNFFIPHAKHLEPPTRASLLFAKAYSKEYGLDEIEPKLEEAFNLYLSAGLAGSKEAMLKLALFYEKGLESASFKVEPNISKVKELYKIASEENPELQYNIGKYFEHKGYLEEAAGLPH